MIILSSIMNLASTLDALSRNWAVISIGLTVTILLITFIAYVGRYIRLISNLFQDTPPPLSMGPIDFRRIEGEQISFRALDGMSLRGMFLWANDERSAPSRGMIIFSHEFGSDKYSCARYCSPLLEAGFDVFSFDYRNHGVSSVMSGYTPRQWATNHEVDDFLGACAFVEAQLVAEGRKPELGVFGISRGAAVALLALPADSAIKAIVVDSAFSSDMLLQSLMRRWVNIFSRARFLYENYPVRVWRFLRWLVMQHAQLRLHCRFPSVRKTLKRSLVSRPVFFIHGLRDSYIRYDQTEVLHELASEPKYLWLVERAKHNQNVIMDPESYAERTAAFFDRYLSGKSITGCEFIDRTKPESTSTVA